MRASRRMKWVLDGTECLGLALGSDFCAEHEWGVGRVRAGFGTQEELDGIERRKVRRVPEGLFFVEAKDKSILGYNPDYSTTADLSRYFAEQVTRGELRKPGEYLPAEERTLSCAWDEKSFGVVAWGKKKGPDRSRLRSLYEAFRRLDVAFWTNVGPFHLGVGLMFAIVSKVPKQHSDAMLEADLDHKALKEAASALGVEKMLQKAGLQWFALSPAWSKSFKEVIRGKGETEQVQTKHAVMFFLNPREQHLHNHGWFTVEQLGEWAAGKGPVMKAVKKVG